MIVAQDGDSYTRRGVSIDGFTKGLKELGMEIGFDEQFASMDENADGSIDFMEWVDSLDPRTLGKQRLKSYVRTAELSDVELQQLDNVINRLGRLVEAANKRQVSTCVQVEEGCSWHDSRAAVPCFPRCFAPLVAGALDDRC